MIAASLMVFIILEATAYKAPETLTKVQYEKFYSGLAQYNLKAKKFFGRGVGLELQTPIDPGNLLLCIPNDSCIKATDTYALSTYFKDLTLAEQLVIRVLYEKFMGKLGNSKTDYVHTLPLELNIPTLWSESSKELFKKFNYISDLDIVINNTDSFERYIQRAKKIYGINQEMLKYENFCWAEVIAESRKINSKFSQQLIPVLCPYIDLANHWPSPKDQRLSFVDNGESKCIRSNWKREENQELMINYKEYESTYFFYAYSFVIYDFPLDYYAIHYSGGPNPKRIQFHLYANKMNFDLLEAFSYDFGYHIDFKNFTDVITRAVGKKRNQIVKLVIFYRKSVAKSTDIGTYPGIRETRRLKPQNSEESLIMLYAETIRKTQYNHKRSLEKEVLFTFYKFLFS